MSEPFSSARAAEFERLKAEAAQAQKAQRQGAELAVIRAASVKPERVKWLWPGRIPAGKVTMLDGDPGLGKSTITLDLTARLTTASPLPDGHRPDKPMGVFLLSAEDGVADTIVPRLKVAGANLELVTIVDHVTDEGGPRPVELPTDLDRIEKYAAALLYGDDDDEEWFTPGLLIVDPVMAYLGGEVNAHRDQDVRRVLHRLKLMAESTGMAVVAVRHLNKMTGSSALYRGGGSIGIIGAARAGLLVGVDPDDEHRRILAVSKSNLAAKPPSLAYRVVGDDLYDTARIAWDGTSEHGADDLLGRPVERPSPQQDDAVEFLRGELAGGSRPAAELREEAKGKGLAWRTVQRAAEALEVDMEQRPEPGRRGPGPSWWTLPNARHGMRATTKHEPSGAHSEVVKPQVSEPQDAGNGMRASTPSLLDDLDHDDPGRFTR
jgi:hypothetical protein